MIPYAWFRSEKEMSAVDKHERIRVLIRAEPRHDETVSDYELHCRLMVPGQGTRMSSQSQQPQNHSLSRGWRGFSDLLSL